jgi:hypothetical protein
MAYIMIFLIQSMTIIFLSFINLSSIFATEDSAFHEPIDETGTHRVLANSPAAIDGTSAAIIINNTTPLRSKALKAVEDEIEEEINDALTWRRRWAKCSNCYEFLSILCMGSSGILAFSSGFFTIPALAYAAGATSTVGLVLKGFSNYASGESAERTASVNAHLRHLGIDVLPVIDNPSLRGGIQRESEESIARASSPFQTNPGTH